MLVTLLLTLVCVTNTATQTFSDTDTLDPIEVAENNVGSPEDSRDLCEALTGRYPDIAYVIESDSLDPNDCDRGIDESNQSTCGDL